MPSVSFCRSAVLPRAARNGKRWRGWLIGIIALNLSGCYGALMIGEPHAKLGTESNALVRAMIAQIPDLRPDIYSMESRKVYGSVPVKPLQGTVPFGVGHIRLSASEGGLHCDRKKDPYCLPLIVGSEVYDHAELLDRIKSTVQHICSTIPVPAQPYPGERYSRESDTRRLREWAGCDGAPRERRTIVLYVVRDLDALTESDGRTWPKRPTSRWQSNVIEKRTFFINE